MNGAALIVGLVAVVALGMWAIGRRTRDTDSETRLLELERILDTWGAVSDTPGERKACSAYSRATVRRPASIGEYIDRELAYRASEQRVLMGRTLDEIRDLPECQREEWLA
jgi:hypothetical protein